MGGGLKSITDPFGYDVNYTNDKTGRLTSVTGDGVGSNPSGNYADNITYRAFGQIKQMDYRLPDDTSQIKLEFDNRLRVNHSEVTKENDFVMKADYNYFADSRVQSKDDLLDNKWDRTMKYDFAGRLSFNQFGMGLNSSSGSVRVYEQTLQYDAFSMLTQRNGVYWGEGMGFTNSYQNGRIQNFPGTYDAAGNILTSVESENRSQVTTIDAVGRRTAMTDHWEIGGGPQEVHYVFENKTEYLFDGDGRPVKEGRGSRQVNVENPPPLTISAYAYQVWSTVLGKSLTKLNSDGTKFNTEIYAGGALIATQKADGAQWRTADPVTGTTAVFYMYNGSSYAEVEEESEPLGQKISKTAPVDDGPINYSAYLGTAREPEWQCQIPESFYGGFDGMPWHCQREILKDFDRSLDELYGMEKEEESPTNVSILIYNHKTLPNPVGESKLALAANKVLTRTLTATTKKIEIGEFKVDVFDDSISGFVSAEDGGDDRIIEVTLDDLPLARISLTKFLEANPECEKIASEFGLWKILDGTAVIDTAKNKEILGRTLKELDFPEELGKDVLSKTLGDYGSNTYALANPKTKTIYLFAPFFGFEGAVTTLADKGRTIFHELLHIYVNKIGHAPIADALKILYDKKSFILRENGEKEYLEISGDASEFYSKEALKEFINSGCKKEKITEGKK